mmetsp:Transcript_90934/g.293586  ORF Transcript_90934/g.293586 Transcript_90934/m.293586 type:complete len:328 (+) Transcript_90934:584-1567(+)
MTLGGSARRHPRPWPPPPQDGCRPVWHGCQCCSTLWSATTRRGPTAPVRRLRSSRASWLCRCGAGGSTRLLSQTLPSVLSRRLLGKAGPPSQARAPLAVMMALHRRRRSGCPHCWAGCPMHCTRHSRRDHLGPRWPNGFGRPWVCPKRPSWCSWSAATHLPPAQKLRGNRTGRPSGPSPASAVPWLKSAAPIRRRKAVGMVEAQPIFTYTVKSMAELTFGPCCRKQDCRLSGRLLLPRRRSSCLRNSSGVFTPLQMFSCSSVEPRASVCRWSKLRHAAPPSSPTGPRPWPRTYSSGGCSLWRASLAVAVMTDLALGRLRTSRLQLLR